MFKIGYGVDFHRFGENRKLILCGVPIKYSLGLVGHSDADVVVHSVCDAILGALGKGDIGEHFPDSDEQYKNINSLELLSTVVSLMKTEQCIIENLDISIILESPKINTYKQQMKKKISEVLNCQENQINIKATTTEQMGFIGKGEGIESRAIILLRRLYD